MSEAILFDRDRVERLNDIAERPKRLRGSELLWVDVDRGSGDHTVELAATWDAATQAPGRLVYQTPELETLLAQFAGAGGRIRILDADGWVLSDAGRVDPRRTDAAPASFVARLLRVALRRDDPPYPAEQPVGRIAAAAARRIQFAHAVIPTGGSCRTARRRTA